MTLYIIHEKIVLFPLVKSTLPYFEEPPLIFTPIFSTINLIQSYYLRTTKYFQVLKNWLEYERPL